MNILIIKLSAIGDVIHALPVSYAIKETYPDARVTWVVEPPALNILEDNPYIDEIIIFEKKKFKESLSGFLENFSPFRRKLKEGHFDIALDLQGLGKSAAIAYFSGAKKRYGTCNMREMSNFISKPVIGEHKNGHIVERYLDVTRAIGCRVNDVVFPVAISEKDERIAKDTIKKYGVSDGASYAVLAVGANWPNKRWPVSYYADLADWLFGQQIIPVFVGGGALDESLISEITRKAQIPPVSIVGKTTLKQLAAVIKNSQFVIGGDTGPVHLAAGLKVPTIMLMGPTDANRNGPYGQSENAIEVNRPCRWCWKRACPKGLDCLSAISVDMVKSKIRTMIK
ncbi:MAG: glycosyltransferase family 9 protein [Schwartzia sp.]|nr:glycosyltransferase family 9 protein [Schwartzia sp. (in: firmicutes)]